MQFSANLENSRTYFSHLDAGLSLTSAPSPPLSLFLARTHSLLLSLSRSGAGSMHIYTFICQGVYARECMQVSVCKGVYASECMRVSVTSAGVHVCMCAYQRWCMFAFACVCPVSHTHTHTHTKRARTHLPTRARTHTLTHAHAHNATHKHTGDAKEADRCSVGAVGAGV